MDLYPSANASSWDNARFSMPEGTEATPHLGPNSGPPPNGGTARLEDEHGQARLAMPYVLGTADIVQDHPDISHLSTLLEEEEGHPKGEQQETLSEALPIGDNEGGDIGRLLSNVRRQMLEGKGPENPSSLDDAARRGLWVVFLSAWRQYQREVDDNGGVAPQGRQDPGYGKLQVIKWTLAIVLGRDDNEVDDPEREGIGSRTPPDTTAQASISTASSQKKVVKTAKKAKTAQAKKARKARKAKAKKNSAKNHTTDLSSSELIGLGQTAAQDSPSLAIDSENPPKQGEDLNAAIAVLLQGIQSSAEPDPSASDEWTALLYRLRQHAGLNTELTSDPQVEASLEKDSTAGLLSTVDENPQNELNAGNGQRPGPESTDSEVTEEEEPGQTQTVGSQLVSPFAGQTSAAEISISDSAAVPSFEGTSPHSPQITETRPETGLQHTTLDTSPSSSISENKSTFNALEVLADVCSFRNTAISSPSPSLQSGKLPVASSSASGSPAQMAKSRRGKGKRGRGGGKKTSMHAVSGLAQGIQTINLQQAELGDTVAEAKPTASPSTPDLPQTLDVIKEGAPLAESDVTEADEESEDVLSRKERRSSRRKNAAAAIKKQKQKQVDQAPPSGKRGDQVSASGKMGTTVYDVDPKQKIVNLARTTGAYQRVRRADGPDLMMEVGVIYNVQHTPQGAFVTLPHAPSESESHPTEYNETDAHTERMKQLIDTITRLERQQPSSPAKGRKELTSSTETPGSGPQRTQVGPSNKLAGSSTTVGKRQRKMIIEQIHEGSKTAGGDTKDVPVQTEGSSTRPVKTVQSDENGTHAILEKAPDQTATSSKAVRKDEIEPQVTDTTKTSESNESESERPVAKQPETSTIIEEGHRESTKQSIDEFTISSETKQSSERQEKDIPFGISTPTISVGTAAAVTQMRSEVDEEEVEERSFAELALACRYCDKILSDMDPNTVICNGCGPHSITRYCSDQHMLLDLYYHEIICGYVPLDFLLSMESMPKHFAKYQPAIDNRHGHRGKSFIRQRFWSTYRYDEGDYAIFEDAEASEAAGEDTYTFYPSVHVCLGTDDARKDIINRLLNVAFYDHQLVRPVSLLFQVLRMVLREQGAWSPRVARELRRQFAEEFLFDAGVGMVAWEDPDLQAEWYAAGGVSELVSELEATTSLLRLWRREHPDPELRRQPWLRFWGIGWAGAVPLRNSGLSSGWNGWGYDERGQ